MRRGHPAGPVGVACDGERLWYVSNSFLEPECEIYAVDRKLLDQGVTKVVGQATAADLCLAGIVFGPDASGQDRLWVSSYHESLLAGLWPGDAGGLAQRGVTAAAASGLQMIGLRMAMRLTAVRT